MTIRESFLRKIWGRGVLWHSRNEQFAKVFSTKIVFFTDLRKFSPSKVFCYTVLTDFVPIVDERLEIGSVNVNSQQLQSNVPQINFPHNVYILLPIFVCMGKLHYCFHGNITMLMDSGEVSFLSDFIPEFCMHKYTYTLDKLVDINIVL